MSVPFELLNAYFMETLTPEAFAQLSDWLQEDSSHIQILVQESIYQQELHHLLTGDKLRQAEGATEVEEVWTLPGGDMLDLPPWSEPSCDEDRVREIEQYAKQKLDAFLSQQPEATTSSFPPPPHLNLWDMLDGLRAKMQIYLQKTITVARAAVIVLAFVFVGLIAALAIQSHRSIAIITDSMDATWRVPKGAEANLYRGWYHLETGYVRILMHRGAEMILQAPAAFELASSNELYLESGSMVAKVPLCARGFTVETPDSKIVDYGTEFGALVGSENNVEVHVFNGKVGVGTKATLKGTGLKDIAAGTAAVLNESRNIRMLPLEERTRLFARSLPNESGLGVPGKRVDLADLVGNGNGFGSGYLGYAIDLTSGRCGPFQTIDRIASASGYVALPKMGFVDGVFIPDGGESGAVVVSSTGAVFDGCPDTSGQCRGYLINGAIFGVKNLDTKNLVHFGQFQGQTYGTKQFSSIGMHANAGITFDLEALRQSIRDVHIARFTALCGISETAGHSFDGTYGDDRYRVTVDFWVLVDGKPHFRRTLNAVPSEPVSLDVELPQSARFLTLMTTDCQGRASFCWSMFAQPILELEVDPY